MSLKNFPQLHAFLSTSIADGDQDADVATTRAFAETSSGDRTDAVAAQLKRLLAGEIPVEELGSEANRWFGDEDEARAWLESLAEALAAGDSSGGGDMPVVKDSNGALLAEGDTVILIKDLPVKGGGTTLKRGAQAKNIHLTDNPKEVECRINGMTIVLKTEFLKKS